MATMRLTRRAALRLGALGCLTLAQAACVTAARPPAASLAPTATPALPAAMTTTPSATTAPATTLLPSPTTPPTRTPTGTKEPTVKLVDVARIWDQAPHNAFTDLLYWQGRWYCVFREGEKHVSPDGALRVIASADGKTWESVARMTHKTADLRDAKITVTPDNRLMLSGAAALHQPAPASHRSLVWFSRDGTTWTEPAQIGDDNFWLWRVTWHRGAAYCMAYSTGPEKMSRFYTSADGVAFTMVANRVQIREFPNEASLQFLADDTALCLLRRDADSCTGLLGKARPPYTTWTWQDLGVRIGGPQFIALPDGRFVAAVRLYDGAQRTSLCWLDVDKGKLSEVLKLPSLGDSSYAGMVWREGVLWVSYYSSHEARTSIYLARVEVT